MDTAILILVTIGFAIYTYKAGHDAGGYVGFWKSVWKRSASRQVVIDLYIAVTILSVWMIYDSTQVGISKIWVAVYLIVSLFMGSFGILFYLIHRSIIL